MSELPLESLHVPGSCSGSSSVWYFYFPSICSQIAGWALLSLPWILGLDSTLKFASGCFRFGNLQDSLPVTLHLSTPTSLPILIFLVVGSPNDYRIGPRQPWARSARKHCCGAPTFGSPSLTVNSNVWGFESLVGRQVHSQSLENVVGGLGGQSKGVGVRGEVLEYITKLFGNGKKGAS